MNGGLTQKLPDGTIHFVGRLVLHPMARVRNPMDAEIRNIGVKSIEQ